MNARRLFGKIGVVLWAMLLCISGCATQYAGRPLTRLGDEIEVCGQLFHTGTPVVLWTDPGGYDAYRTERRFVPWDQAGYEKSKLQSPEIAANGPARYGIRRKQIDQATFERIRGGGWDLPTLQNCVDQFVIHYDECGVSKVCFKTLQDERALSVHFMIDIDGTVYQTLDLKERAWHATRSNDRSVGVEMANAGSFQNLILAKQWYTKDADGQVRISIPQRFGDGGIRVKGQVFRPARNEPVRGMVQGEMVRQYDFTPQQYQALIKLTATLCTVFPRITCDVPRDSDGKVINHVLTDRQWADYQGVLGHYHIQKEKPDPGPAFDWEKLITGARALMSPEAREANLRMQGHPARPVTQ
jgi:N-acetyl-anhydromuramyl-L-alanine amidase AmpD